MTKRKLTIRRVRIPAVHWTAFSIEVFEEVLPQVRRLNSPAVYLALYHHVWHSKVKAVTASFATIAKWTGLDYRTAKGCLGELQVRRFVHCSQSGTLRSRSDPPTWTVPAADFDMSQQRWVPVPSFIIERYLQLNRACVLLPLLLYYQNMRWKNFSYPAAVTLQRMLHWKLRAVYTALKLMSTDSQWERLATTLPRPLAIGRRKTKKGDKTYRYYRVLAVRYDVDQETENPVVFLSDKFAEAFHIHAKRRNPHREGDRKKQS